MTSLPSTLTAKKVHEDDICVRQDILQFFSGESKDYKYLKSPIDVIRTLSIGCYHHSLTLCRGKAQFRWC